MKKLSLILVALATLVMVGCKPLTGSTACPHDWVDTDDTKVTSAKYYEVSEGVYNLEKVEVSPKYKCSICGEEHDKTIAFFTTDDHKTTIGVAKDVSKNRISRKYKLPINEELIKFYNSYYDKVEETRTMLAVKAEQIYNEVLAETNDIGNANYQRESVLYQYISYCNCKCIHDVGKKNKCSCVDICTCDDPDYCVRSCGNKVYFSDSLGNYSIEY